MSDATPKQHVSWMTDSQRERFWSKVDPRGPLPDATDELVTAPSTPCWEWTAALQPSGYGAFSPPAKDRRGKTAVAHRIAYMDLVGPIDAGLHIDHLCRNRRCVNPEHLEPVTHQTNILRGSTVPAQRAKRTHCPQGHEYNEANTHISPRGQRACRECRRAREAEKRLIPGMREKLAADARNYRKRIKARSLMEA